MNADEASLIHLLLATHVPLCGPVFHWGLLCLGLGPPAVERGGRGVPQGELGWGLEDLSVPE